MLRLVDVVELEPHEPHKFIAIFQDTETSFIKKTKFGRRPYSDYTIHKDKKRRELYRRRHTKDLQTEDPTRAGYLSYFLLWGDSTSLRQNIRQYKKTFHL